MNRRDAGGADRSAPGGDSQEKDRLYAEAILATMRQPLLALDGELRVETANRAFYRTFGVEPGETEGRRIYELGNGQWDIPELRELLETILPENGAIEEFRVEHDFERLGRRVMILNARRVDHLQLILLAIEDVTEERRTARALVESETAFRTLVETAARTFWTADPTGWVVEDSPSWRAFTGQAREAWLGEGWADAVHPDDRDATLRRWRDSVAAERVLDTEFRLRRAEGGWAWTNARAAPVRDEEGRVRKWVGMNIDITARKEAEVERELLLGELNHRVKNVFAVIRSLAAQGDGERASAETFRQVFLARLDALVRAHTLALESRWRSVEFSTLVSRTLEPYAGDRPGTVEIEGDPVELDPRRSLSLSLVLHELATNAVKYGALSAPEGRVRLSWRVEGEEGERRMRLDWEERGGPATSPPERGGFGTRLIERVFEYELHGDAALRFRPEGLRLEAWFSLS